MFEPFPENCIWNLGVNLASIGGGNHGEIDVACRPIRQAAAQGSDAGTAAFFDSWVKVADQLVDNAAHDETAGRDWSAAAKLFRASDYYLNAERLQSRDYAPRWQAYRDGLTCLRRSVELGGEPVELHIAFGMDDIDEVMLGANIMERRGWTNTSTNSSGGISRHRVSSAIYYYIDNPNGGEAEYHADTDYLDDNWGPRAWDFKFGSLLWAAKTPPIFAADDIPWDVTFDQDQHSFEPYRKDKPNPEAERLATLTPDDEHAL